MPARTRNTTVIPGKGTYNKVKKTFQGSGPAPSGYTKTPEPSYDEVPTITVTSAGTTASNFASQRAAKRAVRAQARRAKRVARIVKETAPKPSELPKAPSYTPPKVAGLGDKLGSAVKAIAAAPKTIVKAEKSALATAAKLPEQKTTEAFGKPTLGTPKVKEVLKAKKEGRLSGVRKGKVVATPQARGAKKQLKRAQKVYAKRAKPQISGLLNEEQERFAERLSEKTKLPPKLAGDWTLKESGASSAGAGGEAGEQNQLGVGYPAHPTSFSQSGYFNNTTPEKAADATAAWMEGKIGGEYDYQAAPSIQEIPKLAKSGASDAELRAYIAGPSGWGTGEIPSSPQVSATPGKAGPKVTSKLKKAEKQAKKLGIKAPGEAKQKDAEKSGRVPSVVYIGHRAEKLFGLHVGENPAFGGVEPVHVSDSYHYRRDAKGRGEAIDVAGEPAQMMAFDEWVAKKWGPGLTELFYDPGISLKYGEPTGAIGGHSDHVHVAVAKPGEHFSGAVGGGSPVAGAGGAVFVGYGGTPAEAVASSQRAVKAASEGKGRKTSPWQRYWNKSNKLKDLGVGVSTTATSHTSDSVLSELEQKYKVAA